MMADWNVIQGDALEELRKLEPGSVDCCVTSPPYWGLRDYGVDGQLGLEPHPSLYLEKLWAIMDEVMRALKPSGCCFVNLGDTFGGSGKGFGGDGGKWGPQASEFMAKPHGLATNDGVWLRPKQLLLIPSRFAIGCQERGWILRSDVIWSKPNAMPSSVQDRFSCTYEHIFLLVKSPRYWFDLDSVREPHGWDTYRRTHDKLNCHDKSAVQPRPDGDMTQFMHPLGKNPGDTWRIPTAAFPESHFAVFPPELPKRCIRAGCPLTVCAECGNPWERQVEVSAEVQSSEDRRNRPNTAAAYGGRDIGLHVKHVARERIPGPWQPACACDAGTQPGLVLDPFTGSGTTGMVSVAEGRRFLGFELSEEYATMARRRIGGAAVPLSF